jgi:acyl-homoserine lactone acylase PvdQ
MQDIQLDYRSELYFMFVDILNATCAVAAAEGREAGIGLHGNGGGGGGKRVAAVCATLLQWNGNTEVGSTAATLFARWSVELARLPSNETGTPFWKDVVVLHRRLTAECAPGNRTSDGWKASGSIGETKMFRGNTSSAAIQLQIKGRGIERTGGKGVLVTHSSSSSSSSSSTARQTDRFGPTVGTHTTNRCAFALAALRKVTDARQDEGWGVAPIHQAKFVHQVLDSSVAKCAADRTIPHGGDEHTVNVGHWDFADAAMTQTAGPSYRHVVDLGAPEASKFINPLGQNGNQLLDGYDNLLETWSEGGYLDMATSGYSVQESAVLDSVAKGA